MSAANPTTVPELLKEIWDDEIHDFLYEDKPFYAKVTKDTGWDGIKQKITVQYGGMGGVSNTFADALEDRGPNKYAQMEVETSDIFATWSVDNKLITLSRNQKGALVRALDESTEKAMTKLKRRIAWQLWRNGGGCAGKAASVSTTTLVLDNVNDVRNFDIDDKVQFALDDGLANGGVFSAVRRITDIDEDTGTLTFDTTLATIVGLGSTPYLFHKGDYNAAFYGVSAYVTPYAPGVSGVPTSVWGMTRTDFPTRKSGHRFTDSGLTIVESLKAALTKAHRRSCSITDIFCSPEVWNDIDNQLGSQKRYADETVGRVGFTSLVFSTQSGKPVKIWSDPDCPVNQTGQELIFGLNLDQWKLHSAEELPMWLNKGDDGKFMTEENANARQGRIGGYGQLYTKAPGDNFVLTLS